MWPPPATHRRCAFAIFSCFYGSGQVAGGRQAEAARVSAASHEAESHGFPMRNSHSDVCAHRGAPQFGVAYTMGATPQTLIFLLTTPLAPLWDGRLQVHSERDCPHVRLAWFFTQEHHRWCSRAQIAVPPNDYQEGRANTRALHMYVPLRRTLAR